MQLLHDLGNSISLSEPCRPQALWQYQYAGKPKPYFHPVCTRAGHCLTLTEPHDHHWHRGLWFTIKLVNGENFWEESPPYGTLRTHGLPTVSHGPGGRINLFTRVDWMRPDGQGLIIHEQRQLTYVPVEDDAWAMDFYTILMPQADVVLDRTPFTTWGGYGGLILRGTRNWQQTRILFPDGSATERPTGMRWPWADLSGKLDGGPDAAGGFAMFDHPANERHPSPWYGGGEKHMNYLNAAFLFHEPLRLEKSQRLTLRYRVLIHDGLWDAARLQGAYDAFAADGPAKTPDA